MTFSFFVLLLIISGFALNLPMHFGLGLDWVASAKRNETKKYLIRLSILLPVIIILWLFVKSLGILFSGSLEYIFLFPVSYTIFSVMEHFLPSIIAKKSSASNASLVTAVLFISMNVSGSFFEAMILAIGFILGIFMTMAIIIEIKWRAKLENTPYYLKGAALALISIGILSIIFSCAAMMLMRILG